MIFSFSGTGNSLWAAKELGKILGMPLEGLIKYREKQLVSQDEMTGFVFPTYMGDIPWIVKEILLKARFRADSYIFLVMTSNNGKSGRAFQSVDEALCVGGSHLSAGFDLQMPGNCLISSEKENEIRLNQAPDAVRQMGDVIQKKTCNFHSSGRKAQRGFVENSYFYGMHSLKRLTYMKKFQVTKECNGCGLCAEVCPVNNITVREGRALHGDQCAACYACLHWCPQNAARLKVPVLSGRPQYHHPDITVEEIKALNLCKP